MPLLPYPPGTPLLPYPLTSVARKHLCFSHTPLDSHKKVNHERIYSYYVSCSDCQISINAWRESLAKEEKRKRELQEIEVKKIRSRWASMRMTKIWDKKRGGLTKYEYNKQMEANRRNDKEQSGKVQIASGPCSPTQEKESKQAANGGGIAEDRRSETENETKSD